MFVHCWGAGERKWRERHWGDIFIGSCCFVGLQLYPASREPRNGRDYKKKNKTCKTPSSIFVWRKSAYVMTCDLNRMLSSFLVISVRSEHYLHFNIIWNWQKKPFVVAEGHVQSSHLSATVHIFCTRRRFLRRGTESDTAEVKVCKPGISHCRYKGVFSKVRWNVITQLAFWKMTVFAHVAGYDDRI